MLNKYEPVDYWFLSIGDSAFYVFFYIQKHILSLFNNNGAYVLKELENIISAKLHRMFLSNVKGLIISDVLNVLRYSHLFCNGCLIYCSGFATTWLSVCWSSVSAAFWGERHKHIMYLLWIQKTFQLSVILIHIYPLTVLLQVENLPKFYAKLWVGSYINILL